jgi:hypothetical protein
MKNIFSRESQFWPGIYEKVSEAGLGHLSDLALMRFCCGTPVFTASFAR